MNPEWTAYALDFVSFLIHKLDAKDRNVLRRVVLFGSTARGETDAQSDLDLFIDTKDAGRLHDPVHKLLGAFEESVKVTRYWKLLGVTPMISLFIEDLDSWGVGHPSLLKDGVVLFGALEGLQPSLGRAWALVSWKGTTDLTRRTNLHRRLSGYKARGKRYPGLLDVVGGERLSKGTVLVPLPMLDRMKKLFWGLKIPCRVRVVYELADGSGSVRERTVHRTNTRESLSRSKQPRHAR